MKSHNEFMEDVKEASRESTLEEKTSKHFALQEAGE